MPAETPALPLSDLLGRPLRSLRVSVTDRCNLRCLYCMPEEDYAWLAREALLRFEEIAAMIKLQTGPHGPLTTDVERGGAMLRIASRVDRLIASGRPLADALADAGRKLDPSEIPLLKALTDYRAVDGSTTVRALNVAQMTAQMQLEEDVRTTNGVVVVPKGRELSMVLLERLSKFSRAGTLVEPIRVRVAS